MFGNISQQDAEERFRSSAQALILAGDREGLKRLYAHLTAHGCLHDEQAAVTMRQALHEEIHRIAHRVRRGLFSDL